MHPDLVTAVRHSVAKYGDERWLAYVRPVDGELVEERLSFAGLDARARAIAVWLADNSSPGQTALLIYPAGLDFVAAFLGCLYAGVIAVPSSLPSEDPRGLDRCRAIVRDADVSLVLTDTATREVLIRELAGLDLPPITCVATDPMAASESARWSAPRIGPDTIAFLQYTSGSTSEPKGVVLRHASLVHNEHAIWTHLGRPRNGTIVGWLPHYHDMGLIGMLLQPLYAGMNVAFTAPATFAKRPVTWLEMISRYRADIIVAPNFGYDWCVRKVTETQLAGLDLNSVRVAMNGAEPVRPGTIRRVSERLGPLGFQPEAWMPVYGMAEATLIVTGADRDRGAVIRAFDAEALRKGYAVPVADGTELVACGGALDADLRIVDPQTLAELPTSQVGEIWLRSGSVASGYWRQESNAVFEARSATGDGPFLRTGDLGFLMDGHLFCTGRLKDLIILNGRNIYPEDLEDVTRADPALGVCAAFARDEDDRQLVLVQEVREPATVALPALAARIQAAVAHSAGVPAPTVVLVDRGSVARTTSGKIRRGHMRDLYLGGLLNPLHTLPGA
ncbi:fatty acyl-AMP ligase [Kribbella deserti]|uniref:Fatty acyl-AMP ligase n=1 Tax=Kribbella deserti TaxID=1926257 RepID=A0ABV6QLG2_9ACTN